MIDGRIAAVRFLELTNNVAATIAFDGTILNSNAALACALGTVPDGRFVLEFTHPDDTAALEHVRARVAAGAGHAEAELRLGSDGWGWRWHLVTATADAEAGVVYAIGQDVTERRRSASRLAEAEDRFRAAFEDAAIAMSITSLDGRWLRVNQALCELVGRSAEELVGHSIQEITHPDDARLTESAIASLISGEQEQATDEKRYVRPDGTAVWVLRSASVVREGTIPLYFISQAIDITERRAAELQLAHQAMHDALTGLPNRALFLDRLGHALQRRRRRGTGTLAVLFLDVDRFKVINDSLGHGAGDRLLIDVAGRLDAALRPADTVARFGGDEFTILCEDVTGELEAVAIAQRVVDLFEEPFSVDGRELFLSTSVGVALASGARVTAAGPEELIRDADAAMYRAKERGKARYELFDAAMRDHALRRLELETALRRAVERDELRIHLQPEIAVATREVAGFEVLVRWEHPERGLLAPADFIELAEETGLIVPIGEWVLHRACEAAASWPRRDLWISVNVAARQLAQSDLVACVERVLAETGLEPGRLCLELTESAVIERGAATQATLKGLKALGVRLAIDDFGTGWSSLGHLRRFPLDVVKLDRSFVGGLGREPQDTSIAAAIISLAHALGLSTVAEGIETEEQLAVLASLGCDLGQGFLFAGPAPLDAFDSVLAAPLAS